MEVDTIAFKPLPSSQPMIVQALKESCTLKEEQVELGTSFNFLSILKFIFCVQMRACVFANSEVWFYEANFLSGLRFLVHPFIIELLHRLNIAPR